MELHVFERFPETIQKIVAQGFNQFGFR